MTDYIKGDPTKNERMYCVKCREHVNVSGPQRIVWPNNRHALQGKCPHCETLTYKLVRKE